MFDFLNFYQILQELLFQFIYVLKMQFIFTNLFSIKFEHHKEPRIIQQNGLRQAYLFCRQQKIEKQKNKLRMFTIKKLSNDKQEKKQKINEMSQAESSEQQSILLPLNHLMPANQLISHNVKADSQVKVMIKNLYDVEREREIMLNRLKNRDNGIKNLEQRMCFEQEDTLGYNFQSLFAKKLVYARLFEGIQLKKWVRFITYFPKFDGNVSEQDKKQKNIKFLGGIFTQNKIQHLKSQIGSQTPYRMEYPHLLTNNLCILTNIGQKNYQPDIIQFHGSNPSENIMYAFMTDINQYSLILHNDTNSKGSTQWFNFSIKIAQNYPFETIRFNIVNLTKSSSLYQRGMKVLTKVGINGVWKRLEGKTLYYSNKVDIEDRKQGIKYRTLSFVYDVNRDKNRKCIDQVVSFSYGYPYDFHDNFKFWNQVIKTQNSRKNRQHMSVKRSTIGYSSCGLPIQIYKISNEEKRKSFTSASSLDCFSNTMIKSKKYRSVVFLARQHSGETQSSYIVQGIVDFLINSQCFVSLKKKFIYYVIPIVNPEGVLLGNYRTNVKGYDLNRNWRNPCTEAQPQVICIKKQIFKINKENQIALIIDLHGHSRTFNSFFYGAERSKAYQNSKIFPYFCSKKMKQISFSQSYFTVSQDKKNTARAVLSQLYPQSLVYTLQSSFYGYKTKSNKFVQIIEYTPAELRKLGGCLISAFLEYSQIDENVCKVTNNETTKKQVSQKEVLLKEIQQLARKENKKKQQGFLDELDEEWQESDSQAGQELIDIVGQAKMEELNKENVNSGNKQNQICNKDITKDNGKFTQKTKIVFKSQCQQKNQQKQEEDRKKYQGRFLKAIEMIDSNNRKEQVDEFYIHKMGRQLEKDSEPKRKITLKFVKNIRFSSERDHKISKKMPMLLISMIKPKNTDLFPKSYRQQQSPRESHREKCFSGFKSACQDKKISLMQLQPPKRSSNLLQNFQLQLKLNKNRIISTGVGTRLKSNMGINCENRTLRTNRKKIQTCKMKACDSQFQDCFFSKNKEC